MMIILGSFLVVQTIYKLLLPEDKENSFKNIGGNPISFKIQRIESLSKYSPFYDIGFYIIIDSSIVERKFEICLVVWLLTWYLFSTKVVGIAFDKLNKVTI
jgi:hypothetical protein